MIKRDINLKCDQSVCVNCVIFQHYNIFQTNIIVRFLQTNAMNDSRFFCASSLNCNAYRCSLEFIIYNMLYITCIIGCSLTGFYRSNCSTPCPDVNCQYCHIETGTCQGCKPGYQGHRCEIGTCLWDISNAILLLLLKVQRNCSTNQKHLYLVK